MDRIRPETIQSAKKLVGDFFQDESSRGKEVSFEGVVKSVQAVISAYALQAGVEAAEARPLRISVAAPIERQAPKEMFSPEDIALLAENVYHEAKGESAKGQLGVAQVTLARVAAQQKQFGFTLREVILKKNQFSWTHENAKVDPKDQKSLDELRQILWTFTRNKHPRQLVAELSKITGIPASALFYKRKDWREDDPDEKRMSEKTKKMFLALDVVATVDNHRYYAEAEPLPALPKY
jgi:hypothetical protein